MSQISKFFDVSSRVSNGYPCLTMEDFLEGLPPKCLKETKLPQD